MLQCTSWAGDGSHRTPMMTRANETPAIDSVRIFGHRPDSRAAAVRTCAAAGNARPTRSRRRAQAEASRQAGAQKPDQDGAVRAAARGACRHRRGRRADAAPADRRPAPADAAATSRAAAETPAAN